MLPASTYQPHRRRQPTPSSCLCNERGWLYVSAVYRHRYHDIGHIHNPIFQSSLSAGGHVFMRRSNSE